MSELENFILDYARAYESYDPDQVAAFINIPCIFCLGGDVTLLGSAPSAVEFMRTGLRAYEANGCVHFVTRLHNERLLGPSFAAIDVEWLPEDGDGARRMHFSTTYNLLRAADGWKIVLITRHDPEIFSNSSPH